MPFEVTTTKNGNNSKFVSHGSQTKTKKKPTKYPESESESDYSSEEIEQPRRRPRKESSGGAILITGVSDEMSKTLEDGQRLGELRLDDAGKHHKSDTLRLRLDLNLEIEITLKAKIHGDLELALL